MDNEMGRNWGTQNGAVWVLQVANYPVTVVDCYLQGETPLNPNIHFC